jgi:DNA transformation protein
MADDFIAHLQDLFAPLGRVQAKRMFGGHGLYFDGLIFGLVIEGVLYLKVDEETKAAFTEAACQPFVYMGQKKPVTVNYWTVPEEAMETAQDMRPWAQRAMGAALRKANAPKAKRAAGKKAAVKKTAVKKTAVKKTSAKTVVKARK